MATHPLGGLDYEKAYKELNIPEGYHINAIIAVGEQASSKNSDKNFALKDSKPSQRKPLKDIAFDGEMPA